MQKIGVRIDFEAFLRETCSASLNRRLGLVEIRKLKRSHDETIPLANLIDLFDL